MKNDHALVSMIALPKRLADNCPIREVRELLRETSPPIPNNVAAMHIHTVQSLCRAGMFIKCVLYQQLQCQIGLQVQWMSEWACLLAGCVPKTPSASVVSSLLFYVNGPVLFLFYGTEYGVHHEGSIWRGLASVFTVLWIYVALSLQGFLSMACRPEYNRVQSWPILCNLSSISFALLSLSM